MISHDSDALTETIEWNYDIVRAHRLGLHSERPSLPARLILLLFLSLSNRA